MRKVRRRFRLRPAIAAAATAVLLAGLAAYAARPLVARAVRARIEAGAARHGLTVRIDVVSVGLWPPLRLTGVVVERTGSQWLSARTVEAWWRGRTRLIADHVVLHGPAGLTAASASSTWVVEGLGGAHLRVALGEPQAALVLSRNVRPDGSAWTVEARDLPMGRLLDVRRFDRPVLDGGTVRGSLALETSAGVVRFDLDLAARSARLPALSSEGTQQALGEPTELSAHLAGSWDRSVGDLDIPRWSAAVEGAALSGALALHELDTDPRLDLTLDVERVDFERLLRMSGLETPASDGDDLGSASLSARAQGVFSAPASFVVTQHVDFTPPRRLPEAITKLRGDFVYEVGQGAGAGRAIDVSPASSDFIALGDVPPLFVRALLLAEDAGFYGHPGIDLREVPAALLTDWARGGAARGASTITQQLAKNLFLSHEKRLGRKLQELSLTLLLESALGKDRILEIYLNVIEWGPGIHGLRPASRTYFGREPAELTPAQMAFLVSLIPAPVKYQSSFSRGTPGPGLRQIVDNLLAKLRSVDALTEEEYQRALEEAIVVLPH